MSNVFMTADCRGLCLLLQSFGLHQGDGQVMRSCSRSHRMLAAEKEQNQNLFGPNQNPRTEL